METERPRLGVAGAISLTQVARPDASGRSELCYLLKEVEMGIEEKGESRSKDVDVESTLETRIDVCEAIREREGQLLRRSRSSLPNVISGDRHRIPLRNLGSAVFNRVHHQSHRGERRGYMPPTGFLLHN